jgi:hypothetical protein
MGIHLIALDARPFNASQWTARTASVKPRKPDLVLDMPLPGDLPGPASDSALNLLSWDLKVSSHLAVFALSYFDGSGYIRIMVVCPKVVLSKRLENLSRAAMGHERVPYRAWSSGMHCHQERLPLPGFGRSIAVQGWVVASFYTLAVSLCANCHGLNARLIVGRKELLYHLAGFFAQSPSKSIPHRLSLWTTDRWKVDIGRAKGELMRRTLRGLAS